MGRTIEKVEDNYMHRISAVILAAGKGTRMKSDMAKVLHQVHGKPLITYVVKVAESLGCNPIAVVVGFQEDKVREVLRGRKIIFVSQKEQLGTGHAVLQTENALTGSDNDVLILYGDMPLMRLQTLKEFIDDHMVADSELSIITTNAENPFGYGRVVRDEEFNVIKIVEENDSTEEVKRIKEINTGIYCVNKNILFSALHRLKPENKQGEYYLTDIVEIAIEREVKINTFRVENQKEFIGVNTADDLKLIEEVMSHTG